MLVKASMINVTDIKLLSGNNEEISKDGRSDMVNTLLKYMKWTKIFHGVLAFFLFFVLSAIFDIFAGTLCTMSGST